MKIDEQLKNGCQRYLSELERRKKIIQEQKRAEEQKRAKWHKLLYENNKEMVTVIVGPK